RPGCSRERFARSELLRDSVSANRVAPRGLGKGLPTVGLGNSAEYREFLVMSPARRRTLCRQPCPRVSQAWLISARCRVDGIATRLTHDSRRSKGRKYEQENVENPGGGLAKFRIGRNPCH